MKIEIIGNGVFGTFLKTLLNGTFEVCEPADTIVLAVPISAYVNVVKNTLNNRPNSKIIHFINVCSVQAPSYNAISSLTSFVTGIHPLFGPRTPPEKRHAIITHRCGLIGEQEFLDGFSKVCVEISEMSRHDHDKIMARTHLAAVNAAKLLRPFIDNAKDVPDHMVPNSFRLMRQFVQTLDDMPKGTLESIMANEHVD